MCIADASDLSDHRPRLSRSRSTLCLWLFLTYKVPSTHLSPVTPSSHLPCPALDYFSPFIMLRGMVPAAGWSRELSTQHTSSLSSLGGHFIIHFLLLFASFLLIMITEDLIWKKKKSPETEFQSPLPYWQDLRQVEPFRAVLSSL